MAGTFQPRGNDARALLSFAGEIARCGDAEALDAQIAALGGVVGADGILVTDCRDWARDVVVEVGDRDSYRPEMLAAVGRGWREHPVLTRDLSRAAPGARRTSDFVRLRDWRRGALFNDFYRPLGMPYELATQLSWGPAGSSCCVALHRSGPDFSERDRAALELLAPHLRAARARIGAEARAARRLALLERSPEQAGRGAIVVDPAGGILAIGPHAEDLLARWFGGSRSTLPNPLADWLASVETEPLAFELVSGERRLRGSLVRGDGEDVVLLSEQGASLSPSRLAELLPITGREAEVLACLAAGATNDGIAQDLGISRHTVVRHVEHLYAKLGVRTRAAAGRRAIEALRDD
jgi:DNA-binding CsgD family transcriptional regulator